MGVSTPKYSSKACFQCLGEKKKKKNPNKQHQKTPTKKSKEYVACTTVVI